MIDETRELYRPVAVRASLLFFCISDLVSAGLLSVLLSSHCCLPTLPGY